MRKRAVFRLLSRAARAERRSQIVGGWESDLTGCVIDYGAYPDQKRVYFLARDAQPTLSHVAKGAGLEGSIDAGLEALTGQYLGHELLRDDGAAMRIERCLIDANWGLSTDVVYRFCRQSAHSAVLMPSHGRFVGASSAPFSEYKRKMGDRVGHNWRIPNVQGRRQVRRVVFDTNYWKSLVYARLAVSMGDRGCLSLFGDKPDLHRLLAEHLTAEYRVKTEGRGRTVDERKMATTARRLAMARSTATRQDVAASATDTAPPPGRHQRSSVRYAWPPIPGVRGERRHSAVLREIDGTAWTDEILFADVVLVLRVKVPGSPPAGRR